MAADEIIGILHDEIVEGRSIDDIENDIFTKLSPYFHNKETLKRNVCNSSMVSVYEFVMIYSDDLAFSKGLNEILNCYTLAYKTNPNEVIRLVLDTHQEFVERENMMWSIRQRTVPETEDVYEKVMFYFEYIGSTLEISVKGIVHELYALIRLINGQSIDYDKICKTDFGIAINNILTHNCFEEILQIGPNNIKLSDWRNIANHNSYKIASGKIICTYGKMGNSFSLDVEEFLNYIHEIMRSCNILNIARCIFVYDNIEVFSTEQGKRGEFRDNMIFNQIRMTLVPQGFVLKSINKNKNILEVDLQDIQNDGVKTGYFIESRQHIFCEVFKKSWMLLKVSRINIKYFNKYDDLEDVLWLDPIQK